MLNRYLHILAFSLLMMGTINNSYSGSFDAAEFSAKFSGQPQRFLKAIQKAAVVYVGEKHYEEGDSSVPVRTFQKDLLPAFLHAGYKTYLLEHLPSVVASSHWKHYYKYHSQKSPLGDAIRAELRDHVGKTKGGFHNIQLYDTLKNLNLTVLGSGILPEENRNSAVNRTRVNQDVIFTSNIIGENFIYRSGKTSRLESTGDVAATRRYALKSFRHVHYSKQYPRKILMYGGACHNDRMEDDINAGCAAGHEISKSLKSPQKDYVAIDIVPLAYFSDVPIVFSSSPGESYADDVITRSLRRSYKLLALIAQSRGFDLKKPTILDVKSLSRDERILTTMERYADFVVFLPGPKIDHRSTNCLDSTSEITEQVLSSCKCQAFFYMKRRTIRKAYECQNACVYQDYPESSSWTVSKGKNCKSVL